MDDLVLMVEIEAKITQNINTNPALTKLAIFYQKSPIEHHTTNESLYNSLCFAPKIL